MSGVSSLLIKTIKELQELPSLQSASLGGGTSLTLRYNHRTSIDIDLFFQGIIGKQGFETILKEVTAFYKGNILGAGYPCDENDQYVFLRFFIKTDENPIKIEIMQNMMMTEEPENLNGIRLLTITDIGLLKLMTSSNRASLKDIYDLDYLTEDVSLLTLFKKLELKQTKYNLDIHKSIFDLDNRIKMHRVSEI